MTDRMDINRVLPEMRAIKSQTQAFNRPDAMPSRDVVAPADQNGSYLVNKSEKADGQSFGDLFTQAIDKVNETQKQSGDLATAYQQGDPNVDITEVMVAAQKSSVSFQAMVQVRNKLVEAYRDVMNMPI